MIDVRERAISIYHRSRLIVVWLVIAYMCFALTSLLTPTPSYVMERLRAEEFVKTSSVSPIEFGKLQEKAKNTDELVAGIFSRQQAALTQISINDVLLHGVIDDVHNIYHLTYTVLVGLLMLILKEGIGLLEISLRRSSAPTVPLRRKSK